MKLSKQVPSVETSRELNDALDKAGIEIESNWYWFREKTLGSKWTEWELTTRKNSHNHYAKDKCPTFTLPELLSLLPEQIKIGDRIYGWIMNHIGICYQQKNKASHLSIHDYPISFTNKKENDATKAAKLLIWALEKEYLSSTDATQKG